jgi:hypothetical protein
MTRLSSLPPKSPCFAINPETIEPAKNTLTSSGVSNAAGGGGCFAIKSHKKYYKKFILQILPQKRKQVKKKIRKN